MTYVKETKQGRLEKYIGYNSVITFMVSRNKIFVTRKKIKELGCNNRFEYINQLKDKGYMIKAGI